jgi:hypothetical protein
VSQGGTVQGGVGPLDCNKDVFFAHHIRSLRFCEKCSTNLNKSKVSKFWKKSKKKSDISFRWEICKDRWYSWVAKTWERNQSVRGEPFVLYKGCPFGRYLRISGRNRVCLIKANAPDTREQLFWFFNDKPEDADHIRHVPLLTPFDRIIGANLGCPRQDATADRYRNWKKKSIFSINLRLKSLGEENNGHVTRSVSAPTRITAAIVARTLSDIVVISYTGRQTLFMVATCLLWVMWSRTDGPSHGSCVI